MNISHFNVLEKQHCKSSLLFSSPDALSLSLCTPLAMFLFLLPPPRGAVVVAPLVCISRDFMAFIVEKHNGRDESEIGKHAYSLSYLSAETLLFSITHYCYLQVRFTR